MKAPKALGIRWGGSRRSIYKVRVVNVMLSSRKKRLSLASSVSPSFSLSPGHSFFLSLVLPHEIFHSETNESDFMSGSYDLVVK